MLQVRHLQQVQIRAVRKGLSYNSPVIIDHHARSELTWWIENLRILKGKPIKTNPPDLIIFSDAAKTGGWGAECKGTVTGGQWTAEEDQLHINQQEMIAADLAIRTFTTLHPTAKNIHLMVDNTTALSYLVKMGGTKNQDMTLRAKSLWAYLLKKGIQLSVEYLPSTLNVAADTQSRNVTDWSEWKLNPAVFQKICSAIGQPDIDLFASRTSHQMIPYVSLKPDPVCIKVDAMQHLWIHWFPYAFPPFNMIGRVLKKAQREGLQGMIIITPIWITQTWYPLLLNMAAGVPLLLPQREDILRDPLGGYHQLVLNGSLQLGAWIVSGQVKITRAFRSELRNYSTNLDPGEPELTTTQPGRNLVAGVVEGKLIPFALL